MKKILIVAALFLAALTLTANAQTFGSGTSITGTTNAPLVVSGAGASTNLLYLYIPPKTVVLSGIANTNETIVFSYGGIIAGQTNPVFMASLTNVFLSGTNGGSWTTNIPGQTLVIPFVPYAQAFIGSNYVAFPFTNQIYVP
jgi:predicted small secreted protein